MYIEDRVAIQRGAALASPPSSSGLPTGQCCFFVSTILCAASRCSNPYAVQGRGWISNPGTEACCAYSLATKLTSSHNKRQEIFKQVGKARQARESAICTVMQVGCCLRLDFGDRAQLCNADVAVASQLGLPGSRGRVVGVIQLHLDLQERLHR